MPRPYGFLRNELGSGFAAFFLELYQGIKCAVEGALVGGLVAQEEGQLVGIDAGFGEGLILNTHGALHEPPGLGHLLDQERFGFIGGSVLGDEVGDKRFEGGGIFARDDDAAGSEAVLEGIAAGSGFTFGRGGTGGSAALRMTESRSGDRLAGSASGPTSFLSRSGSGAALLVFEFSGFAFLFAALIAEFA